MSRRRGKPRCFHVSPATCYVPIALCQMGKDSDLHFVPGTAAMKPCGAHLSPLLPAPLVPAPLVRAMSTYLIRPAASRHHQVWNLATMARFCGGILTALILFNFAVSFFVTPRRWIVPPLPISQDGPSNPFRKYRQFSEGISVASINDSGARFTTEFIPNAPVVAILGDSYVLARNVNDGEPMGAVTATLARAAGHSLNVRELGRSGGSPADYALAAPDVLARWNPVRVFVVLSARGFELSLTHSPEAAIEPDPNGGFRVVPIAIRESAAKRLYWRLRISSPLAELLSSNPLDLFQMMRSPPATINEARSAPATPPVSFRPGAPPRVEGAPAGLRIAACDCIPPADRIE